MKIILPKTLVEIHPDDGPLFFFGGPVQGGDKWPLSALLALSKHFERFVAAIPDHSVRDGPFAPYVLHGDESGFSRQLDWERHYLALAAYKGCIVFWLPEESKTKPRTDGDPYATDTRGELAEWRGRMMYDKSIRLVLGAEPRFPGLDTIVRNFSAALNVDFFAHPSLETTIAAAATRVKALA